MNDAEKAAWAKCWTDDQKFEYIAQRLSGVAKLPQLALVDAKVDKLDVLEDKIDFLISNTDTARKAEAYQVALQKCFCRAAFVFKVFNRLCKKLEEDPRIKVDLFSDEFFFHDFDMINGSIDALQMESDPPFGQTANDYLAQIQKDFFTETGKLTDLNEDDLDEKIIEINERYNEFLRKKIEERKNET